jgi:hypothetical protein
MDSENQRRYQTAVAAQEEAPVTSSRRYHSMTNDSEPSPGSEFMILPDNGQLQMVNSRRRNGLILFKPYYAEFAGPGAAVGGDYDVDCYRVLPIGNLSLLTPETYPDRENAYKIRRQWVLLTKKITDSNVPQQRVQMILNQFESYFDSETVAQIPDEAFALLVGVLPQTVKMVRHSATPGRGRR